MVAPRSVYIHLNRQRSTTRWQPGPPELQILASKLQRDAGGCLYGLPDKFFLVCMHPDRRTTNGQTVVHFIICIFNWSGDGRYAKQALSMRDRIAPLSCSSNFYQQFGLGTLGAPRDCTDYRRNLRLRHKSHEHLRSRPQTERHLLTRLNYVAQWGWRGSDGIDADAVSSAYRVNRNGFFGFLRKPRHDRPSNFTNTQSTLDDACQSCETK